MKSLPKVLVYTEHPMCSIACADAVCDILNSTLEYDVRMFGKDSFPILQDKETFFNSDCIVFPGGDGDSDQFDNFLFTYKNEVKDYVTNGGIYLGICMGSYFAGQHYFDILDPRLNYTQYVRRPNSTIHKTTPNIVELKWLNKQTKMYFHDGASFFPKNKKDTLDGIKIYGTYKNKDIAALIYNYGKGKVGLIGPHPEASKWWFYCQSKIKDGWHDCIQHNLFISFFKCLMNKSLYE
jgi:glutamine amidotransferase-like uncharacterized protein